jgi:hypothetical protein
MLEHYFRRLKRLAEVKRNPLAPFLEEAAERYRAEGYVHKYAQGALGYAASFGEWLQVHRVKLDRVTQEHLDGFLGCFVSASPEKTHKRTRVLAATRLVLGLSATRMTRQSVELRLAQDQNDNTLRTAAGLSDLSAQRTCRKSPVRHRRSNVRQSPADSGNRRHGRRTTCRGSAGQ